MASNLENLLYSDANWLVEVSPQDTAILEQYLHSENGLSRESDQVFKLPNVIGILPIRNAVAYPGTVTPLAIGRQRSKRLLADTRPNVSIIGLVTQHNPKTDRPGHRTISKSQSPAAQRQS